MISGNVVSLEILGKSSGTVDHYCTAPFRSTLRDVRARCHVDPGDADTLTVSYGSYTLGVATFSSSISAGDAATWVEDTSSGNTVIAAGGKIKVQASELAAVGTGSTVHVDLEFDPHAATKDNFA